MAVIKRVPVEEDPATFGLSYEDVSFLSRDDEIELRVLVRCCRNDHPSQMTLAETRNERITWVHFE